MTNDPFRPLSPNKVTVRDMVRNVILVCMCVCVCVFSCIV